MLVKRVNRKFEIRSDHWKTTGKHNFRWSQMAEVLNEYFNSVFTTEDISSLPIPFTKFEGNKSEH